MLTLALDTSTARGGVAVGRGATLLAVVGGEASRTHGERLPADVFRALGDAGVALDEVERLAVVVGPGGFTGLRVGIATVQGLAMATGLRVIGMSALEARARAGLAASAPALRPGHRVGVLMDARRGDCFGQAWQVTEEDGGLGVAALDDPAVDRAGTLLRRWRTSAGPASWWCVADTPDVAAESADLFGHDRVIGAATNLAPVLAVRAAAVAEAVALAPHAIQPIYVRRPDAILARERRAASTGDAT